MLADFLLTSFGILLLVAGGEATVRGAAALATRFGVSKLAIGLTVVALGTSAPELAVNLIAAWRGQTELSFGNVFGSNLANLGLVTAAVALTGPLTIRSVVVSREAPMMMLATLVAAVLALDAIWGAGPSGIARGDGLVLLLLFLVFVWYTLRDLLHTRGSTGDAAGADGDGAAANADNVDSATGAANAASTAAPAAAIIASAAANTPPFTRTMLLTFAGLIGLAAGGAAAVRGAESLALGFGVSPAIIGLTLVAIGTSLPELVTSIVASLRGHTDLAIGNVVGSNICNLLIVLGATSAIHPVPVPAGGATDILAVLVLSSLFWLMSASHSQRIIRAEAALLLLLYAGYMLVRL